MDFLKAEIANKRKLLESKSLINDQKKYFKREELNRKIDEEYWQKQTAKEEEKRRKIKEINHGDEDDSESSNSNDLALSAKTPEEIAKSKLKKLITSQSGSNNQDRDSQERIMQRKEVIKRLRERDQPILLFGESEIDAFRRLRRYEIIEPDSTDKGFRNDFQEAMEKVDAAYLEEIVKSGGGHSTSDNPSEKKRGKNDVKIEEMNTNIEEILQQAANLGRQRSNRVATKDDEAMEKVDAAYLEEIVKSGGGHSTSDNPSEKKRGKNDVKIEEMNTNIEEILQQAANLGKQRSNRVATKDDVQRKSDCAVILKFLKYLLELWGKKLNLRSEAEKRTTQGRLLTALFTQTQEYLKPLFKQLTKETILDDILKHLILIIKYLLDRDYVKASDAYLQMAIGNAPWPIGVTMVGIHARTGREKIFAQNIAHVLNDETQRKYIQALKRLMTQCQKMFPTDPSRCVEYTKD